MVVSGAQSVWKLNQTVAFLFGEQLDYEYHSQRGKCVESSHFVVSPPGSQAPVFICGSRSASALNAKQRSIEHKNVKVAELFQGATTTPTGGILWDSAAAANAAGALLSSPGRPAAASFHLAPPAAASRFS